MGRGFSWLDTGTQESLIEASGFVRTVQKRQGLSIGCLEEISLSQGWISREELEKNINNVPNNSYGNYLRSLLK